MFKSLARQMVMLVASLMASMPLFAQGDIELAEYYFRNGEFEQARLYYDKIWKNNQTNKVYENYLATLVALGDISAAESVIKKKIKSRGDKTLAYVDLGSLYLQFDRADDAEKQFDAAIKELEPGRSQAIRLANSFIKLSKYDYALRTYERAIKLSKDDYPFLFEVANVQGMMGRHEEMVDAFLDLLRVSPNYIQTVQNSISRTLNPIENEASGEMLRVRLLKKSQRYPEETIYNELLIWLFNQQKEFTASIIHAKALDRRFGENGLRLMEIGNMARRNEDWDAAYDAYRYVAEKGPSSDYYVSARNEMMRSRLESLNAKTIVEASDYQELAEEYEAALTDLGTNANTAGMMKELAKVYAFHLENPAKATQLLEEAIAIPGIYNSLQAMCKLQLADILLLEGDIWEASLLYSQVELAFKEDALGAEAKFRNARISYYTGDFDWAQAQLDVLKASTSKLISNDAIALSLLITDNYNMDTTTVPMQRYAEADLLAFQNRWSEANSKLDSILNEFPGHTLTDEIYMLKARNLIKRGSYERAEEYLNKIIELHFYDILADDALFLLAELYETVYENEAQAMTFYRQLIEDYPGSLYVVEARKRFRRMRGDSIQ